MTPIEIARERAAAHYRRYQASTTDASREHARTSMLAWHRAAQLEALGDLPCEDCDGCHDLDTPSCGTEVL